MPQVTQLSICVYRACDPEWELVQGVLPTGTCSSWGSERKGAGGGSEAIFSRTRDKKVTGCRGYQLTVWSQTSSLTSLSLRLATKCLILQSAGGPQAGGMTALVPHPRGLRAGGFPSQATEFPPTLRSGTPNHTHTPPGYKCLSNTKFNFV